MSIMTDKIKFNEEELCRVYEERCKVKSVRSVKSVRKKRTKSYFIFPDISNPKNPGYYHDRNLGWKLVIWKPGTK